MAAEPQHRVATTQQADNKRGNRKWSDLVRDSSKPSSVFQLRKWREEDRTISKDELRNLGFCLVAYILGRFPGALAVENVRKSWNVECSCSYHEKGWLIFRFHNEAERDSVLLKGPYNTFGTPWLMKKLPPFFKFTEDSFSSVPTWIRLQGLPLECWTQNALGKLASFVGEPLAADECTATMAKTSFARILVEVDVTRPLVRQICTTLPDGSRLVQDVIYEREPLMCSKCNRIGHKTEECRMQSGSRRALNAQHQSAETEEAHRVQIANAVGNNASHVDLLRPSTSANVPGQPTIKTPLSGKNVQNRSQTAAALTPIQATDDSTPEILQTSSDVAQVSQQNKPHEHQMGGSAVKGSRQVTRSLDAVTGRESMQTTGAAAGMVQQQSGLLGADATIQQKQGCQQGLLQAPAGVLSENLPVDHMPTADHRIEEAKQAMTEDEFPPLAAGESGRRKMPARKPTAAKVPAANAKKMQQAPDLQSAAASTPEVNLSSTDIQQQDNVASTASKRQQLPELQASAPSVLLHKLEESQVTESEAGLTCTTAEEQPKQTAEQDLRNTQQAGIQHATADSQQGSQQDNAVQSHQEDKQNRIAAKVVSVLYDKEPIVPNGFMPQQNWRHNRATRSAKRRGY